MYGLGISVFLLYIVPWERGCAAGIWKRETCFGDLGCFQDVAGKHPMNPNDLQTTFLLYVRDHTGPVAVISALANNSHVQDALQNSGFSAQKDTKFITHGFQDNSSEDWILEMKDELLIKGDFNIFVTDWGKGAITIDYDFAVATTRVVAAQLANFIRLLVDENGLDLGRLHLIGSSLGAQISGNAGSKVPGIARITALDAAKPDFDVLSDDLRLDPSDAIFVDSIHTDGEPFNLRQGYGFLDPVGHLDFYPNGGIDQPGCTDNDVSGILAMLGDDNPDNSVVCSHSRAHTYFIESINSGCKFRGYPCSNWTLYEENQCHTCPDGGCPVMGYDADQTSARGTFFLTTVQSQPYCAGCDYFIEMDLSDEAIDSQGRLYITLIGDHDSPELEFSRDFRHYRANDTEKHMIAVQQAVGTLTAVKVRFQRETDDFFGRPLGRGDHITIHKIIVEDKTTRETTVFCTGDVSEATGYTRTFNVRDLDC